MAAPWRRRRCGRTGDRPRKTRNPRKRIGDRYGQADGSRNRIGTDGPTVGFVSFVSFVVKKSGGRTMNECTPKSAERMGRPRGDRLDPRRAGASRGSEPTHADTSGVRRLCRKGRRHRRIPPRTNLRRCRPRYYFENLRIILSPRLDGRSVEKMASDGGTPFKELQRWTILLVGRSREIIRGPGAMQAAMHANNHERGSRTIADRR